MERRIAEQHIVVVDQTVSLLRTLDKEILGDLSSGFNDVFCAMQQFLANVSLTPTTAAQNICPKLTSVECGRPAFDISAELLEDLLGLGFSHTKIAEMLGVSHWTIPRRIKAYGLGDFTTFSKLTDDELDQKVGDFILQRGATSGQVYIAGYLRSLGLRVQRRRVRRCIARLDPKTAP